MPRQLLVVHDSRTVRNIIRRQILAEAPDVVVHDAGGYDQAKELIKSQPFDVVICDDALSTGDGLTLCKECKTQALSKDIGVVLLLAPSASSGRFPLLARDGFSNYLVSPFTQEQLAAQIALVSDLRKKRMHRRVSVPQTKVMLKFDVREYPAELINISLRGLLCEFRYDDECGDLFRLANIRLCFPSAYDSIKVDDLWGAALRITVESHCQDLSPGRIRLAFQFVAPSDASISALNDVLAKAENEIVLEFANKEE